jgi:hypothetical protein
MPALARGDIDLAQYQGHVLLIVNVASAWRALLQVRRGLAGLPLVAADVVEVCPAYDHAEITALAAATRAYESVHWFACGGTVSRVTTGSSAAHRDGVEPAGPRVQDTPGTAGTAHQA